MALVLLYLVLKRFLFLISFLMFVFSQLVSEDLAFIILFGICFVELLIMCSVILLVYLLMSASLRLSQRLVIPLIKQPNVPFEYICFLFVEI